MYSAGGCLYSTKTSYIRYNMQPITASKPNAMATIKPELLSPAGSLKNMRYAFAYGADAVYAGQPRYSLRVRNNSFDHDNLQIGINEAHAQGKKLYVVANIQPHNSKLKTFQRDIEPIIAMRPDALIMSDPGLIMMVRDHYPDMPIHLSVQANAINSWSVEFWQRQGLSRVILSRELSIEEISEIRHDVPGMELEVFVHGALCMAYSGRCLLSGYMNKRDPNQGACTNACRWGYHAHSASEDEVGQLVSNASLHSKRIATLDTHVPNLQTTPAVHDLAMVLEEHSRPGELMDAFEDEHGTYIMNSKDLRAVQYVGQLSQIGLHSLKIEGRTKSFYYCARTAQVYRKAIDDAAAGKPFDQSLMHSLEGLAHRGYTEGFLRRHTHDETQNYSYGSSVSDRQQMVGEVIDHGSNHLRIAVKNKFSVGDSMELMTPQGNLRFAMDAIMDSKGKRIDSALGSGHVVDIPLPANIDGQYAILLRNLPDTQLNHQAAQQR